jgi:large subunit ribosomal protein L4
MAVSIYTSTGSKSTTQIKLPGNIFAVEVNNHDLLKEAYLAYMANGRSNLAKTLTRSNVRGGGAKPWRQKGTGRARVGSSRNPIWRSGGVVFGPDVNRNYTKKLNLKAKRLAIKQALTLASKDNELIIIETFKTIGKVQDTNKLLKKLGAKGNILIVVSVCDDLVLRATNNLPDVKATFVKNLNVFDILNADTIIVSKKSIDIIESWLGDKV